MQWGFPKIEKTFPRLAHRFFVTIFFSPLNYPVPRKEKVLEKEAEKFTIQVGGKRIQCYAWGKGPVILLIHGWAGRATQFRKFIFALAAKNYRVVGFDGPAHGHSTGRSTNIQEFEAVLKMIYDKVGIPEAIIAHSFGGGAALFAAMKGLRVKKLINIASPSLGDGIIHTYLKTINGSPATGSFFKSFILKTTGKPFDEYTGSYFITKITQDMALLLIHDQNDSEVPINHALELMKHYPKAILYKTTGLGHTRILKDDAVITRCLSFIQNGTPPARLPFNSPDA